MGPCCIEVEIGRREPCQTARGQRPEDRELPVRCRWALGLCHRYLPGLFYYAEFSATNRSFYSWEMGWKAVPFAERLESRIAHLPANDRVSGLCSADCYVHVAFLV